MAKRILLILFVITNIRSWAQVDSSSKASANHEEPLPPALGEVFRPTIGPGTGLLSFWGDLNNGAIQSPWTSRPAFDITISQPLNRCIFLDFYALFGKVGFNERSALRNENFEAEIRLGGVQLMYDFSNFLHSKQLRVRPWISAGIEGFEFLSKTDLYDRWGRKYHYWNDGSIKNMAENAPNAQNAVLLERDYTYESDIRELNKDGFGKYPERSWAIPLGVGVMYRLNKRFDFKMGTTLHMTFTDYLDGISAKSKETRVGNAAFDKFFMTSFSIHYDLVLKTEDSSYHFNKALYDDVDFMAIDMEDEDGDGVNDFLDESHKTPMGVEVDEKGRPLDSDGDWIPDYRDKEKSTPSNVLANPKGVALTEVMTKEWEDRYMDSTGMFSKVVNVDSLAMIARGIKVKSLDQKYYTVELGRFKGGIPSFVMEYLLSVNDVSSIEEGDSVIVYNAGSYEDISQAFKRRKEFIAAGVEDAKIAYFLRDNYVILTDIEAIKELQKQEALVSASNKEDSIRLALTNPPVVKDTSLPVAVNPSSNSTNPVKEAAPDAGHTTQGVPQQGVIKEPATTNPVVSNPVVNQETLKETGTNNPVVSNPTVTTNPAVNQETPKETGTNNPVVSNPPATTNPAVNQETPKETVTTNPVVNNPVNNTPAETQPAQTVPAGNTNPVSNSISPVVTNTNPPANTTVNTGNPVVANETSNEMEGIVYRVQLGAYKNKLSPSMFKHAGKIVELKTEDGYYKYTTVAYRNIKEAARHRAEILEDGYPDAFIAAYKDGKRISLAKAGAQFVDKKDEKKEVLDENKVVNAVDKSLISYKVQLGVVHKEGTDPAFEDKIKHMKGVDIQHTPTGLIRYIVGDMRTYNEAQKLKSSLVKQGFVDAFVVATFKGEFISIQEANALSGSK